MDWIREIGGDWAETRHQNCVLCCRSMTRWKATECESLVTSLWPRTRLLCASTRSCVAAAFMSWCSRFVRLCVCVPILVNDLFFFIKVPTHYYQIHYYRYRCTVQLTPGIQATTGVETTISLSVAASFWCVYRYSVAVSQGWCRCRRCWRHGSVNALEFYKTSIRSKK